MPVTGNISCNTKVCLHVYRYSRMLAWRATWASAEVERARVPEKNQQAVVIHVAFAALIAQLHTCEKP